MMITRDSFCVIVLSVLLFSSSMLISQTLIGIRPIGFGGAYASIAEGGETVFWNPAGLSRLNQGTFSIGSSSPYDLGLSSYYFTLAHPVSGNLAFAIGGLASNLEDSELNFSRNILYGSASRAFFDFIHLGVNLKYFSQDANWANFYSENASGFGYDAGVFISSPFRTIPLINSLQFGYSILDIADSNIKYGDTGASDAVLLQRQLISTTWKPMGKRWKSAFTLRPMVIAEFETHPDEDRVKLGVELELGDILSSGIDLSFRGGHFRETTAELEKNSGSAVGMSLAVKLDRLPIRFDYAKTFHSILPSAGLFSLTLNFKPYFGLFPKLKILGTKSRSSEVFPALTPYYWKNDNVGFPEILLANERKESIRAHLEFRPKTTMFRPYLRTVQVAPQDTLAIKIKPQLVFNNTLQKLQSGKENIAYSVRIQYEYADGLVDSVLYNDQMWVYGPNDIVWDNFRKIASFISPKDPGVKKFATYLRAIMANEPELYRTNLQKAILVFEALRLYGVKYQKDNLAYHWETKESGIRSFPIDNVKYPFELLKQANGDCDDLTVAFTSILAALGIESSILNMHEHIFLMFNTEIPVRNRDFVEQNENKYVGYLGKLWIPFEITDLDESFEVAWRNGFRQYDNQIRPSGTQNISFLSEAWKTFPPVNIIADTETLPVDRIDVDSLFINFRSAERMMLYRYTSKLLSRKNSAYSKRNYIALNAIAAAYAHLSEYDASITVYTEIIANKGDHSQVLNNLANAYFLKGDLQKAETFYLKSIELNSESVSTRYNLIQLYLKMEDSELAMAFQRSVEQRKKSQISALVGLAESINDYSDFFAANALTDNAKAGIDDDLRKFVRSLYDKLFTSKTSKNLYQAKITTLKADKTVSIPIVLNSSTQKSYSDVSGQETLIVDFIDPETKKEISAVQALVNGRVKLSKEFNGNSPNSFVLKIENLSQIELRNLILTYEAPQGFEVISSALEPLNESERLEANLKRAGVKAGREGTLLASDLIWEKQGI